MIEMLNLGDHIIACRVDGKIEREQLNRLSDELERKAAGGARLRVYAEIGDLSFLNLIGLSQDLKAWADRKYLVEQLDKAAVVSDSALVKQGMQYTNKLPASVELRLFSNAERDQARRWIET